MPNVIEALTAAGVDNARAEELLKDEKLKTVLTGFVESGLRQSDYDRKMNSGKAELSAAQARVAEQTAALETERARMNEQFLEAQRQREAADLVVAGALAKARTAGALYGLDLEKELFGDRASGVTPSPAPTQPAKGTSAPNSDLGRRMDDIENLFKAVPNLTVELQDIALQHAQLFPDRPLVLKTILDKAVEQRRSPTQVWDDEFGASAARNERQAEKFRLEGEERARVKFQQEASKRAASPFGIPAPPSPIFAASANKNLLAPGDRGKHMQEAIERASAALAERKYAPGRREA